MNSEASDEMKREDWAGLKLSKQRELESYREPGCEADRTDPEEVRERTEGELENRLLVPGQEGTKLEIARMRRLRPQRPVGV